MFLFYVSDLMGNDRINFHRLKKPEKRICDEDIPKFFDKPHHTGGYHFAAEYGPVKNIGIL